MHSYMFIIYISYLLKLKFKILLKFIKFLVNMEIQNFHGFPQKISLKEHKQYFIKFRRHENKIPYTVNEKNQILDN